MNLDTLLTTPEQWEAGFRLALDGLLFRDAHGHDMPLCMGRFAIQGLNEATAYHYLEGENFQRGRYSREEINRFRAMQAADRTDLIVDQLLGDGALAISTAMNGVYRIATSLGIPGNRPFKEILADWRGQYGTMKPEDYRDMLFQKGRIRSIVSTQSICVRDEAVMYLDDDVMAQWDRERYEIGIRCDELLRDPAAVAVIAKLVGLEAAGGDPNEAATQDAMRQLVELFLERFRKAGTVRYLSLSMGAEDRFWNADGSPGTSRFAVIMRRVIIPLAKKHALPVFMMPYVRRKLNPDAGPTGDVVSHGDVDDLKAFVAANDDVAFILTGLHPALDYDFCFLARCLSNVRVAGFWWGCLNSVYVRPMIQGRFEMLGVGWTGLNSDMRITDQGLYKWEDYLTDLKWVMLNQRFPAMVAAQNPITARGIRATIEAIQSTDHLFWTP